MGQLCNVIPPPMIDKFVVKNLGTVSFNDGRASVINVPEALTTSILIVNRMSATPTSLLLTVNCSTNGILSLGAYNTSGAGANYTGNVTDVVVGIYNE